MMTQTDPKEKPAAPTSGKRGGKKTQPKKQTEKQKQTDKQSDDKKPVGPEMPAGVQMITIAIPIKDLERDGYGISKSSLPRNFNAKRLSVVAGRGLAHLQCGMMACGYTMEPRPTENKNTDFPLRRGREVISREDVLVRLLELVGLEVGKAIDQP